MSLDKVTRSLRKITSKENYWSAPTFSSEQMGIVASELMSLLEKKGKIKLCKEVFDESIQWKGVRGIVGGFYTKIHENFCKVK